jgi:hypothetical protein
MRKPVSRTLQIIKRVVEVLTPDEEEVKRRARQALLIKGI